MTLLRIFNKRKNGKNENELNNQELLKDELNYTYEVLCKAKSEEIAEIISAIATVHSSNYINIIVNTAKKKNNHQLAKVISATWTENQNHNLEKSKKALHNKFNSLFNSLYGGGYQEKDLFDVSKEFLDLKKDCEKLGEFDIAEKCDKIINDLFTKGRPIFNEIRKALSEGNPWRTEFGPNKDSDNELKK